MSDVSAIKWCNEISVHMLCSQISFFIFWISADCCFWSLTDEHFEMAVTQTGLFSYVLAV